MYYLLLIAGIIDFILAIIVFVKSSNFLFAYQDEKTIADRANK